MFRASKAQARRESEVAQSGARKVVLAALSGNLAIAVTKFVTFAFTGSTAMLTEAIHSLVDTGNQGLLLIGQRRAGRPASESHPFGYGMETYFWSFIVALMIFLAGGAVAIWEGVEKLVRPAPIQRPYISLIVIAVSAVFEGLSFRTAYREYKSLVRGREVRVWRFLKLSKDPNVFATLLEDGAALIGLTLAAAGTAAAGYLDLAWGDGAASIAIGCVLVAVALFMANETRSLIAGEAASPVIVERVRKALAASGDLGRLEGLKTLHLGPQTILVALAWRFPAAMTRADIAAASAELTTRVRAADERIGSVLFEGG